MNRSFHMRVLSPGGPVLEENVQSAVLPGLDGSLGIMAGHAPLIAALTKGTVQYEIGGKWNKISVSGGTAAVKNSGELLILAEVIE